VRLATLGMCDAAWTGEVGLVVLGMDGSAGVASLAWIGWVGGLASIGVLRRGLAGIAGRGSSGFALAGRWRAKSRSGLAGEAGAVPDGTAC